MDERKRKLSSRYWAHKVKISKIEGARRQIDCAITLWFLDGDEVSIHTLAAAAHQVIHDLKTHNGGTTKLLYDLALVKDEHRKQWKKLLKDASNFFKHADKDPNPTGEIEFSPFGNSHVFGLYNNGTWRSWRKDKPSYECTSELARRQRAGPYLRRVQKAPH